MYLSIPAKNDLLDAQNAENREWEGSVFRGTLGWVDHSDQCLLHWPTEQLPLHFFIGHLYVYICTYPYQFKRRVRCKLASGGGLCVCRAVHSGRPISLQLLVFLVLSHLMLFVMLLKDPLTLTFALQCLHEPR